MTQDNLKLPRPRGWSLPKLTGFFEHMWGHVIATFANKQEAHRLCRIDDLMFKIADDWRVALPTPEQAYPFSCSSVHTLHTERLAPWGWQG
jgi:hypothetical protein